MARMFPNRIPEWIEKDPLRRAERLVYRRLEADLDERYTVFAWVPWLNLQGGALAAGEADFLLAHEQDGLLVIEIKGGGVEREAGSGAWTSTDREGVRHAIKDPVRQALGNVHALLRRLRELTGWEQRRVRAGYAVVLPDCRRPAGDLALHAPLGVFAFQEDMANLGHVLARMLRTRTAIPGASLGADGLAALESLVAGGFSLPAPLGAVLREEDRAILQLTEEQYRVLDGLAGNPRVLVSGAAGTGKTMLAMEQARRLARQGRRTLLTCFNHPLAEFLQQSTGARERLTIANFHQLCYRWARAAGLEATDPDGPDADALPEAYFQSALPRLFLDALDRLPDRFDSIVVDEGQDFRPEYWDVLELSFEDLTRATLHVFRDTGQDIFGAGAGGPHDLARFELTENLRNTRQIHRVVRGLSAGDRTISRGPVGGSPVWIPATPEEEPRKLAAALRQLIEQDEVAPADIAVLVPSRPGIAALAPGGAIGPLAITNDPLERSTRVLVESIRRFKGLERRAVILAGLRPPRHGTLDALLYVGVSRARTHLIVIAEPALIERLRPRATAAEARA